MTISYIAERLHLSYRQTSRIIKASYRDPLNKILKERRLAKAIRMLTAESLPISEIASRTGGKYFRATDKEKLKAIYDEINQLEKTKVEITDLTIYHEEFLPLLLLAMALLLMEFLFSHLILKRIP